MPITPITETPSLESCVKVYGSFSKEIQQKACEIAGEIVQKVLESHRSTIKEIRNLDNAESHFLGYVSEALDDQKLAGKIDQYSRNLIGMQSISNFSTAIEWGAIDHLKELFKTHRI